MKKKRTRLSIVLLTLLLASTITYHFSSKQEQVLGSTSLSTSSPTLLSSTTSASLPTITNELSTTATAITNTVATSNNHHPALANSEIAKVVKVTDGDTVQLSDGRKLRYIGVDTPETVDPRRGIGCYGKQASEKNRELVLGKEIIIEKDISDTDKFGRLLRYVYVDGIMINQLLISEGFGKAKSYPPDIKYQEQFREAEKLAREQRRGLWGEICVHEHITTEPPNQNQHFSSCPKNCREAKAMGITNITSDHHCYRSKMDGDGDGIACQEQ